MQLRAGCGLLLSGMLALVGIHGSGRVFAQVQLPDSPAGRQLQGWLDAFDGSDFAAYQAFLGKNLPSQVGSAGRLWQFRQMTGGFDVKKVEESAPTRLVVLVQDRGTDQIGRLTIEVDAAEPHVIRSLDVRAIPRPADMPLPHLSTSELIAAARQTAEKEAAADRFAGAVLIAYNGKPVFAQAYGMADREHQVANTLQTRFRIGSMNKMFTAVAVLQLAEAGKLRLGDTVGKFLTDYPNQEVATKVTVRELLTHTGGTGDIFGPEFGEHREELRTLGDYVRLYGNRPPRFEPGSRFEYSNYGFILLGAIVEKASGQRYYDYVREHVYAPAGMTETGSEPENQEVPGRSVGYTAMGSVEGGLHPNADTLPWRGSSAGGGYSTVGDLLRFATALESHKLLDAHFTELATTGQVDSPMGRYGLGFEVHTMNGSQCFGHAGGAPGMNGALQICPGPGYVVAVLANLDPPAAQRVEEFVVNRLPER
jgi:D-alanyl-D-alanine carboxypeptidase